MRFAIGVTFVEGPGGVLVLAFMGENFVGVPFMGETFIGEAFMGENFVGDAFMGETVIGEAFMGETFIGEAFMGDFPTKPLPRPWGGGKAAGKQSEILTV